MDRIFPAAALLAWLGLPVTGARLFRAARGTCLRPACWWCLAAWLMWGAARSMGASGACSEGLLDILWYAFAVLLLVPPVAVLGARRPLDRVWNWFVLVPLALVFLWPGLAAFAEGTRPATWGPEAPIVAGYALVLFMGTGNYLGTCQTLPALLFATSALLVLAPLCPTFDFGFPRLARRADMALLLIACAAWLASVLARRVSQRAKAGSPALDRIWIDFRNTFGIVWARRLQDRFNDTAARQHTGVRLGTRGIEPDSDAAPITADQLQSADESLRWLLQKFVDQAWIDSRLSAAPAESGRAPPPQSRS